MWKCEYLQRNKLNLKTKTLGKECKKLAYCDFHLHWCSSFERMPLSINYFITEIFHTYFDVKKTWIYVIKSYSSHLQKIIVRYLELTWKLFVVPVWSTSWMMAESRIPNTSRSLIQCCKNQLKVLNLNFYNVCFLYMIEYCSRIRIKEVTEA